MDSLELIEHACKRATKVASLNRLDIDFCRGLCLYREVGDCTWSFYVCTKRFNGTIDTVLGHTILCRLPVGCIELYDKGYQLENIVDSSAKLQTYEQAKEWTQGAVFYMPVLDAIAHNFIPDSAVDSIALALAQNGSCITVLRDEDKRLIAKKEREFKKSMDAWRVQANLMHDELLKLAKTLPDHGKKDPTYRAKVLSTVNAIQQAMPKPWKIPSTYIDIVGKPCKSLEEMAIWLDMNDV